MEWIERLNSAMQYLEEHLTEEIDYEQVARVACCSSYHFQRMFTYMADLPLSEYLRRRRMSVAAAELQSGAKILDVALKYGYASPTAFNRAFQSVHGMAPSKVKNPGVTLKAFPPISFTITIKGAVEMNYRIEQKNAFRMVGVSQPMSREVEENFAKVPLLWQRVAQDGTLPRLLAQMDGQPQGVLGVCACNTEEDWRYVIGVASEQPAPEGMEEYQVGAFTWAIFTGQGECPAAIQQLEQRIVTEWLPTSGYEYANGPDVELYLSPDPGKAVFEVWVPVVKKQS